MMNANARGEGAAGITAVREIRQYPSLRLRVVEPALRCGLNPGTFLHASLRGAGLARSLRAALSTRIRATFVISASVSVNVTKEAECITPLSRIASATR